MAKFSSKASVRDLVTDGMRIGLGGFWFVRTPMALAEEILASGATDLEIACFGGGLALERLVASGRVRTVYFSFHSMDVIGSAPEFRKAVEDNGVVAIELTTQVMFKALQAAHENLPFAPVRGPLGSDFVAGGFPLTPFRCPVTGADLYAVPALRLDLALVHGTRADRNGNVEIVGARGLDRRIAAAATRLVVSVEETVPEFNGAAQASRTTIPHFLVDTVVEHAGAAYPSSCLPFYSTDFPTIRRLLTDERAELADAEREQPVVVTVSDSAPARTGTATPAEQMAFLLAQRLRDGCVYTVGSVTPLSMVAYQLAKRTHAPGLVVIPFAGLVDVGTYPVGVSTAEPDALAGASGFWGMDDLYEWLYEAGRIDAEIFCPAQIDRFGRVNNSSVRRCDGSWVRLPGQAGIADVATLHRNLVMYQTRHTRQRLVHEVDFAGGHRALRTDAEREAVGLSSGETTVITNLCVLRFDVDSDRFTVDSLHAGVSAETVRENTGFHVDICDTVPASPQPPPEVLSLIRTRIDPNDVRELEFVPGVERGPRLSKILHLEQMAARGGGHR